METPANQGTNNGDTTASAPAPVQTAPAPATVAAPVAPAVTKQEAVETSDDTSNDTPKADELTLLKQRANLMGISFSNNIGVEALKQKIAEKNAELEGNSTQATAQAPVPPTPSIQPIPTEVVAQPGNSVPDPTAQPVGATGSEQVTNGPVNEAPVEEVNPLVPPKQKKLSLRQMLVAENMRLIRVRITCMDPKKKDLPGEVITVANEYLGTVKKFIPFGEQTDGGYHIPYCLFKALKNRKFLNIRTVKDQRTQTNRIESNWVREFAIEVLDPLTPEELNKLATAQMAAGSVDQ